MALPKTFPSFRKDDEQVRKLKRRRALRVRPTMDIRPGQALRGDVRGRPGRVPAGARWGCAWTCAQERGERGHAEAAGGGGGRGGGAGNGTETARVRVALTCLRLPRPLRVVVFLLSARHTLQLAGTEGRVERMTREHDLGTVDFIDRRPQAEGETVYFKVFLMAIPR
jgi:hypothetical protein